MLPRGHVFAYVEGTKIPNFFSTPDIANEYSLKNAAEIHDNALRWIFATFETEESALRRSLLSRLHIQKGQKILVTGVGAGNDLPYLVSSREKLELFTRRTFRSVCYWLVLSDTVLGLAIRQ